MAATRIAKVYIPERGDDMKRFSIEIDSPKNSAHFFRPLGRNLRGRFEAARELNRNGDAASLLRKYPEPIPGQRITLEDGTATISDALHDPENQEIRQQLERQGFRLGPPAESVDVSSESDTFAYWMTSAVEAGCARVVEGTAPKVDDAKVRKNFVTTPQPSESQQLADALREQNALLRQLISAKRIGDVQTES